MKKIFIVAIAAILFCTAVMLPVGAYTVDDMYIPDDPNWLPSVDDWENWDRQTYPYVILYNVYQSDGTLKSKCAEFYPWQPYYDGAQNYIESYYSGNSLRITYWDGEHFVDTDLSNATTKQYTNSAQTCISFQPNIISKDYNVIQWSNFDIYTSIAEGQELWFKGNQANICDGSSCPATDMNIDGICDDCGNKLRLVMPSTYPTLPEVTGKNLHSVVLSRDGGFFYIVLKSDTPYSVRGDVAENYLITVANEQKVDYVTFKCTDGKNWVQNNSGEAYATTVGDNTATLLDSTFDWYKDGTIFFHVPLWRVMDNLTQGEMKLFNPTMGGILTTLMVCGVGCLALLAVLKLFGKRSLISRN